MMNKYDVFVYLFLHFCFDRDRISRVTYELLSPCAKDGMNHVISVSSTGQITSHSSSGSATVLVTVHEEFGFNQTALIEVEVGNIKTNFPLGGVASVNIIL